MQMEPQGAMTENLDRSDLLEACRDGRSDALKQLYELYQRRVFSIALNYFGCRREVAEDVTQKVFLKLFTNFSYRGESEFTTWLYRITVNACTDEARRLNRFVDISGIFGFREGQAEVQQLMTEASEISTVIAAEIAKLRPKIRTPIVLKYVEGMSYQEIADVLECSIGTVASRLNRGHKQLAAKLGHLRDVL